MHCPNRVRGRGLALYITILFGSTTVGSVIWGEVGSVAGLPAALFLAAAGALLAIPLTWRWKLQTSAWHRSHAMVMSWPAPIVTGHLQNDQGPVMVTVEYRINPKDREAFLTALERLSHQRRRDGAYAWGIFEDTAERNRFLETFVVESWLEHLRQHERVTNADRMLQDHIHRLVQGTPKITHFIAAALGEDARSSHRGLGVDALGFRVIEWLGGNDRWIGSCGNIHLPVSAVEKGLIDGHPRLDSPPGLRHRPR